MGTVRTRFGHTLVRRRRFKMFGWFSYGARERLSCWHGYRVFLGPLNDEFEDVFVRFHHLLNCGRFLVVDGSIIDLWREGDRCSKGKGKEGEKTVRKGGGIFTRTCEAEGCQICNPSNDHHMIIT